MRAIGGLDQKVSIRLLFPDGEGSEHSCVRRFVRSCELWWVGRHVITGTHGPPLKIQLAICFLSFLCHLIFQCSRFNPMDSNTHLNDHILHNFPHPQFDEQSNPNSEQTSNNFQLYVPTGKVCKENDLNQCQCWGSYELLKCKKPTRTTTPPITSSHDAWYIGVIQISLRSTF